MHHPHSVFILKMRFVQIKNRELYVWFFFGETVFFFFFLEALLLWRGEQDLFHHPLQQERVRDKEIMDGGKPLLFVLYKSLTRPKILHHCLDYLESIYIYIYEYNNGSSLLVNFDSHTNHCCVLLYSHYILSFLLFFCFFFRFNWNVKESTIKKNAMKVTLMMNVMKIFLIVSYTLYNLCMFWEGFVRKNIERVAKSSFFVCAPGSPS